MSDRWDRPDIIGADEEARRYATLEVTKGLELMHRASGTRGTVVAFTERSRLVLEDPVGGQHEFTPFDGAFAHRGTPVALRAATSFSTDRPTRFTASGSIDSGQTRAKVAAANRIWVEGIHDAELLEKIWGDDLRAEGVVVEPIHGADDLESLVRSFDPGPRRRLGILLDHLVDGSKESRIAARVTGPHVLVEGHPYVDVWQAIRPGVLGITAWPVVPRGTPWKDGVVASLAFSGEPGEFWRSALERVSSYRDVETPLITAVETLLDFVTGH
jgi:hypothetical protein